jgi:alpha-glucoside transport system permease protein
VAVLFFVANWRIEGVPKNWQHGFVPFLFVGPAMLVLGWYLFLPTVRSFYLSFFDKFSDRFVGLQNYLFVFTDRSKIERVSKSFVFLPMAISFVGAGVIWKFVYAYRAAQLNQIGLLNAIVTAMGGDPVNWLTIRPRNTFLLIGIFVWLQTGFSMVVFSAAIKQVLILTLKIFDIVFAMTNGLFGTEVLASQQYKSMFKFLHYGRGSAIAIVILLAVIPVIWYNLKQFGKREVF